MTPKKDRTPNFVRFESRTDLRLSKKARRRRSLFRNRGPRHEDLYGEVEFSAPKEDDRKRQTINRAYELASELLRSLSTSPMTSAA